MIPLKLSISLIFIFALIIINLYRSRHVIMFWVYFIDIFR